MPEIIDIVQRLTYDVNETELQTATKAITTQLNKIGELTAAVTLLKKELKEANDPTRVKAMQKEIIAYERQIKALTSAVNQQLLADGKLEQQLVKELGAIQTLSQKIIILQQERSRVSSGTQRAIELEYQLAAAYGRLSLATQNQRTQNQNLARGNANLSFSFAQLLREAPAFTYSLNTGILALSNNIPIFIDQLQAARAAGNGAGAIFRSLGSAIFSLNGILTLATAAFTIFTYRMSTSSKEAEKNKTSIDDVAKAIDNYAKMLSDAANFNDEGTNAAKRNLEAIKAQGVVAGEVFAAEKKAFEGEQALRRKEEQELKDRIKIYNQVGAALTAAKRGRGVNGAKVFERSVSGLPSEDRAALTKAFNEGTLTRRSLNEKINALNEELKTKSNDITQSEVAFNSQQREKEYQLRLELSRRINENEIEFAKLRLERGKETFDKIQEQNALELKANEDKLNQEIDTARKAGTLSIEIQSKYEEVRLQIRKTANERLIQENIDFFRSEQEALEEVIKSLDAVFDLSPAAIAEKKQAPGAKLTKIPGVDAALKSVSDDIKRGEDLKQKRRRAAEKDAAEQIDRAIDTLQTIYDAQLAYADKEIALHQTRIGIATTLAERGNTELLKSETERLEAAQRKRDEIGRKQIQLNNLITISEQAKNVAEAIGAVIGAAKGDPYTLALRVIAAAAAIGAATAAVSAAVRSQNAGFAEGGYTGQGGKFTPAGTVHKGEFVFNQEKTAKYRAAFEQIHAGVNPVLAFKGYYGGSQSMSMQDTNSKLDALIDATNASKVNNKVFLNEHGVYSITERQNKLNRRRFGRG